MIWDTANRYRRGFRLHVQPEDDTWGQSDHCKILNIVNNWKVFPQNELLNASSDHQDEQMNMYTDHNNDASRQYEPANDAQGQLTERTTLNIEDNYVVFHQYEFSCEFSVWMGLQTTLYTEDNNWLYLQGESSYDI